ncbi:spore germination protein KC [Neobacillus niacini]|uniref:Ger(x)C family spore germination protein n=1 Tax=Neobacillus driksii TaxID=3035913 RepID=UPI0027808C3A|nr:Ger(x)C family spore germination protein [Neobacillus niacini]MDQ0971821.1 spore germination protein KC [Neobacillus niacini]
MSYIKIILGLGIVLSLAGCWDRKELEQMSYTIAIGLDLPEKIEAKEKQAVDVTFQFANPKLNIKGAPGQEEDPERNIVTLTAPDIVTAKNMANSFITRQISFSHAKVIVVSEELARTDVFYRFMGSALKEREVRRETSIIVTKENASEFIRKNKPESQIRAHKYYQFIIDRSVETGLVPESTINRLLAITDGDADLFLAINGSIGKKNNGVTFKEEDQYLAGNVPKKGGNQVQLIGSAVFKEGKMIAKLTGEETRSALILDNTARIEDMYVSYQDPLNEKYMVACRVKKKTATKVKIKLRKGPPVINVMVPIEIEVLSSPSMENYAEDLQKQRILKKKIESELKENLSTLVKRTQDEFKSEPFYWSLYARPLFSSTKEYEKWDWTNKNYPFATVNIKVDVEIVGFGKQMKESEMEKVRD